MNLNIEDIMKSLEESNELIGNREELFRNLEDKGYLFFRQLLNRNKILEVKSDIVKILKDYGVVDKDSVEPIWNGNKFSSGKQRIEALSKISLLKSFIDLGNSREIVSVFEGILDGQIFSWTQKTPRVLFPESTYKKNDVMGCSISLDHIKMVSTKKIMNMMKKIVHQLYLRQNMI